MSGKFMVVLESGAQINLRPPENLTIPFLDLVGFGKVRAAHLTVMRLSEIVDIIALDFNKRARAPVRVVIA